MKKNFVSLCDKAKGFISRNSVMLCTACLMIEAFILGVAFGIMINSFKTSCPNCSAAAETEEATDVSCSNEQLIEPSFESKDPIDISETQETVTEPKTETEVTATKESLVDTKPDISEKKIEHYTEPTPETTASDESQEVTYISETEPSVDTSYGGFSEADVNRIASVVNGEVGSICGTITITYSDGTKLSASGDTIRMMHALVVANQAKSSMFPSTVSGCIRNYWSSAYDRTEYRSSSQWQSCRNSVINALNGGVYMPSNVYGATQDPYFGNKYSGYHQYARVDWNTGWVSGTFYYYAYN